MSKIPDQDEFSTHAVPQAERVAVFRVAAVASMVSFSLPTFIAGIEVSAGVGSELSLPAILAGSAIIFLIGWLMGRLLRVNAYGAQNQWDLGRFVSFVSSEGSSVVESDVRSFI